MSGPVVFRQRIRSHNGRPCPWCGTTMRCKRGVSPYMPTREHVVPKSRGGTFIVIVCQRCNTDKGDLHIDAWVGLLERKGDKRAAHVRAWMANHPWLMRQVRAAEAAALTYALDEAGYHA